MKNCYPTAKIILFICAVCIIGCAEEKPSEPQLLASGFHFPEGPSLDEDGNLYLVNLSTNIVNKISPDGEVSVVMDVGGVNNGAILDKEGNLFIACTGRKAILKIDTEGGLSVVTAMSDGDSLLGPNDFAWDEQGRLYFTDPKGSSKNNPIGRIHYIDLDGKTKQFAEGFAFPNGLAFDLDKTHLYLAETNNFRIWRFEVNEDGTAGEKELFFYMGEKVLADGMKLDVQGNLWIAVYTNSELWCISPEGKIINMIPIPGEHPTNLVFGGPDMRTAWVTVHESESGKVFTLRMPVAGVRVVPE